MRTIKVIQKIEGLKPQTVEYGVNDRGNGLWINGKQITGTCDFNASTPSELMRKLKSNLTPMESYRMVRGSAIGWN